MPDEYISRAEALEVTTRTCGDYAAAFAEIRKLPTADVAPVVRCKDCANSGRTDSGRLYCKRPLGMYGDIPVDADAFCSNGEYQTNTGATE